MLYNFTCERESRTVDKINVVVEARTYSGRVIYTDAAKEAILEKMSKL